jgi:hypothetical protein
MWPFLEFPDSKLSVRNNSSCFGPKVYCWKLRNKISKFFEVSRPSFRTSRKLVSETWEFPKIQKPVSVQKHETGNKAENQKQVSEKISYREPKTDQRAGNWILKLRLVSRNRPGAGNWILKLPGVSGARWKLDSETTPCFQNQAPRWNLDPETSGSFQNQTMCWNLDPETSGSFQNAVSGNLKIEFVEKSYGCGLLRRSQAAAKSALHCRSHSRSRWPLSQVAWRLILTAVVVCRDRLWSHCSRYYHW